MSEGFYTLGFIVAVIAALLAANDVFYTTGKTYFEACYEKHVKVGEKPVGSEAPRSTDPYRQVLWDNCDKTSERGIYAAGFLFAGLAKDSNDTEGLALARACPSTWNDLPWGGVSYLTMKLLNEQGGPLFIDRIIPAEMMIGRVYGKRWPQCDAERKRQGFPKIVEKVDGKFDWETRCLPCEARQSK